MKGGVSEIEKPKEFYRFCNMESTSNLLTFLAECEDYAAVAFVCLKPINFLGFGVFAPWSNDDPIRTFKVIYKIKIDKKKYPE